MIENFYYYEDRIVCENFELNCFIKEFNFLSYMLLKSDKMFNVKKYAKREYLILKDLDYNIL